MSLPPVPAVALAPVTKVSTEDLDVSVSFAAALPAGLLLDPAQTPTVEIYQGPDSSPTFAAIAVNTSTFVDPQGNTVAVNAGVLFRLQLGTPTPPPGATAYMLRITAQLTNGRKRAGLLPLFVQG